MPKPIIIDGKFNIGLMYDVSPYMRCKGDCLSLSITERYLSNGARQYWIQCRDCGRGVRAVKDEIIPTAKRAGCIIRQWDNSFIEKENSIAKEIKEQYETRRHNEEEYKKEWRERYESHLRSQKWVSFRELVLDRDRRICQGCLLERATHVHHRTYEHMGDELMYELISLCESCHNKAHDGQLYKGLYND